MRRKPFAVAMSLLLSGFLMNACEKDPATSVDPQEQSSDQQQAQNLSKENAAVTNCKTWVRADQPATSFYTPNPNYQFNSSNPLGSTNTVTRLGVGNYRVDFPGLGTTGGTVQVSAYGGNHTAKVASWGPSGTTQNVFVRCFNTSGNPVDGRFTVLFYKEIRGAAWSDAFLWAHNPTAASYTPSLTYQWNSKGGTNTMTRLSTGRYRATLPGINLTGGTVLVTAYGNSSQRAKVESWGPSGGNMLVTVRCYNSSGNLVDTQFTLSFMSDVALGAQFPEESDYGGYVWANNATATTYTPSLAYQLNNTDKINTIRQQSLGAYRVSFPLLKSLNKTTAIVTAYGTGSEYCAVNSWTAFGSSDSTNVFVRSYNNSGSLIDSRYTLLYLTDENIIF